MVAAAVLPLSQYLVQCGSCRTPFDAMQAGWCSCVTKTISLACPSCQYCLCKASPAAARDFWFRAPELLVDRRREEEQRRARTRPTLVPDAATKVLIVDDDEEIRFIADYALRDMGFSTMTTADPDEVMNIIAAEKPDIVLTDALMPKMDGRELCKQIKLRHPNVKVVVMTSLYTAQRYKAEAHRVFHADDYLAKPIDFAKLEGVLRRLSC